MPSAKLHSLDVEWEIDDIDTVPCHTVIHQVETVIFRMVEKCNCRGRRRSVSINHKIIGGNLSPKLQTAEAQIEVFSFRLGLVASQMQAAPGGTPVDSISFHPQLNSNHSSVNANDMLFSFRCALRIARIPGDNYSLFMWQKQLEIAELRDVCWHLLTWFGSAQRGESPRILSSPLFLKTFSFSKKMREKLSPARARTWNVLPLISPIKRVEQKRIKRCALREKRLVVVLVKIFRLAKKGEFSPFFPSRKAKNASSDFSKTLFSAKEKIEGEACLGWNGKRVTKKSFSANELEKIWENHLVQRKAWRCRWDGFSFRFLTKSYQKSFEIIKKLF